MVMLAESDKHKLVYSIFRHFSISDKFAVSFRQNRLLVDDKEIDFRAIPSTLEALRERIKILCKKLEIVEPSINHIVTVWLGTLAEKNSVSSHELLEIARSASQSILKDNTDNLLKWRAAITGKIMLAVGGLKAVERFEPDFPFESRNEFLETGPLLVDWPRKLLTSERWAYLEAPFPDMDPLPLDEVWVDLNLLDPQQEAFSNKKGVHASHEGNYGSKDSQSEPAGYILDKLRGAAMILGVPGSGKTTLVKWLARRMISNPDGRFILPLIVPLRKYALHKKQYPDATLLHYALNECGIKDKVQQELWIKTISHMAGSRRENVLLFLDGWDEVPPDLCEIVKAEIEDAILGFAVIVTSRRTSMRFGLRTNQIYEIAELGRNSVYVLTRKWFDKMGRSEDAGALIDELDRSVDLFKMARNPFLHSLLCGICVASSPTETLDIPPNRTILFQKTIQLIYSYHDRYYPSSPFNERHKKQVEILAFWLIAEAPGAPKIIFDSADVERCLGTDELLEGRLKYSRLISRQYLDVEGYQFIHKSFHEYLAAKALSEKSGSQFQAFLNNNFHDTSWAEVFRFVGRIAGGEYEEMFWKKVAAVVNNPDRIGLVYVQMARYLTEKGVRDGGRSLIGIDIRDKLWEKILAGIEVTIFVNAYIELDSESYVSRVEDKLKTSGKKLKSRLIRSLKEVGKDYTSDLLFGLLDSADPEIAAVARYNAERNLTSGKISEMRAMLLDETINMEKRLGYLKGLGLSRDKDSVAAMTQFHAGHPEYAKETVMALGDIGGEEAVNAIYSIFHEASLEIKEHCLNALLKTRDAIAKQIFINELALRDPNDPVVELILWCLSEIPFNEGTEIIYALLRQSKTALDETESGDMENKVPESVRAAAAYTLSQSTKQGTADILLEVALNDYSDTVRELALDALKEIASPSHAFQLEKVVFNTHLAEGERSKAVSCFFSTIRRFPIHTDHQLMKDRALRIVKELFRMGEPEIIRAATMDADVIGEAVTPLLLNILEEKTLPADVIETACTALGNLHDVSAILILQNIIRSKPDIESDEEFVDMDDDSRIVRAASTALIKISPDAALKERGSAVNFALAHFSVETGVLVFDNYMIDARGSQLVGLPSNIYLPNYFPTETGVLVNNTYMIDARGALLAGKLPSMKSEKGVMEMRINAPFDIGVVVALHEELEALLSVFPGFRPFQIGDDQYYYLEYRSILGGAPYRCVVSYIGSMGPELATANTTTLIHNCNPSTTISIGIAAGINKDVRLCDVFVADVVDLFMSRSKAVPSSEGESFAFQPGGQSYRTTRKLVEKIKHFQFAHKVTHDEFHDATKATLSKYFPDPTELAGFIGDGLLNPSASIHIDHLGSSSILLSGEAFIKWVHSCRDRNIKAAEMESGGFMTAHDEKREVLVIRGISDFGDSRKKELDSIRKGVFREVAMHNAITFLKALMDLEFFNKGNGTHNASAPVSDSKLHSNEVKILQIFRHFKISKGGFLPVKNLHSKAISWTSNPQSDLWPYVDLLVQKGYLEANNYGYFLTDAGYQYISNFDDASL